MVVLLLQVRHPVRAAAQVQPRQGLELARGGVERPVDGQGAVRGRHKVVLGLMPVVMVVLARVARVVLVSAVAGVAVAVPPAFRLGHGLLLLVVRAWRVQGARVRRDGVVAHRVQAEERGAGR